jgi:ATP-dependent DNA helicase RecQ
MMREYAESRRCRLEFLLGYFGDEDRRRCGHCDNCRSGVAAEVAGEMSQEASEEGRFAVGAQVTHARFGTGQVADVESDRITVLFERVGYRTLSLDVVEDQHLLTVL